MVKEGGEKMDCRRVRASSREEMGEDLVMGGEVVSGATEPR